MTRRLKRRGGQPGALRRAFSLVELLVAMSVFLLIMTFLFSMIDQGEKIWISSSGKIGAFREARTAFESLSSTLSRASLNPYWDYDNANDPKTYVRRSELRFTSGPGLLPGEAVTHSVFFQAPLGMSSYGEYSGLETLFNSCGFYIERNNDATQRPAFLAGKVESRIRFRLMQWLEPTEKWGLFDQTSGNPGYSNHGWFTDAIADGTDTHVLAENVIALVILPKLPALEDPNGTMLAPSYSYDSSPESWPPTVPQKRIENQLPPVVQITMVSLHETAAVQLELLSDDDPVQFLGLEDLFQQADQLDEDLETLTGRLTANRLRHHVFQSAIKIRGAKWSSQ